MRTTGQPFQLVDSAQLWLRANAKTRGVEMRQMPSLLTVTIFAISARWRPGRPAPNPPKSSEVFVSQPVRSNVVGRGDYVFREINLSGVGAIESAPLPRRTFTIHNCRSNLVSVQLLNDQQTSGTCTGAKNTPFDAPL